MPATAASAAPIYEGHGDGAVDIDPEQPRHGLILLAGAHVAAEPGPRHQPGEDRQPSTMVVTTTMIWHVGEAGTTKPAAATHAACNRR